MKKTSLIIALLLLALPSIGHAAFGDTQNFVSKPYFGDGKQATRAYFDFPEDVAVTKKGGFVIADTFNHTIRRIKPNGKVKTVAGRGSYGDKIGGASEAEFAYPKGVAVGGGAVYVADSLNGKIKKVDEGKVTTLVAGLNGPEGVAFANDTVYFLDTGHNSLKKVSKNGGSASVVTDKLSAPKKLSIDSEGKFAYIANSGTYQVKKVNLATGDVSVVAGSGEKGSHDGTCSEATFNNLWGVRWHDENTLFVSAGDGFDDRVRKIDLSDGCEVTTFASDTNMLSINFPRGLTTYDGNLYVAATGIGIIYKYSLADVNVNSKFAGKDRFNVKRSKPVLVGNPKYLMLSKDKQWIYFSENNRLRKMKNGDHPKKAKLIAGNVIDNYVRNQGGDENPRFGEDARFSDIPSFAVSHDGKKLYAVDRNNNRIMEVTIESGENRYLTGAGKVNLTSGQSNDFADGAACPNEFEINVKGCAYFNRPQGTVLSKDGKYLYVTDTGNNRIRRVTVTGDDKGRVVTVAGNGTAGLKNGTGTDTQFSAPIGIARSGSGKVLYIADRDNHVIRKMNVESGAVTTYAGTGANGYNEGKLNEAVFSLPEWIHRGQDGNLYISDVGSQRIRMIDRNDEVTKLVAGSGTRGYTNGGAHSVRMNNPKGLLSLGKDKLLVAQMYNDVISQVSISGVAPFADPAPEITSTSPQSVEKNWFTGGDFAGVQIKGKNFRHGAVAWIGPHKAVKTYVENDGSIVAELPYNNMEAGYYTIRVENSDGQYDDIVRGLRFSVNSSAPTVDYWPPKK